MTLVPLPAVFDLSAAKALAETLGAIPGPMALDGAEVERIGIAGLQILLSAQATAAATGRGFAIDNPSEPLRAAAQTAGAHVLLTIDS